MYRKLNLRSLPPVDEDQFESWRRDPVTKHLFKDFEDFILDFAGTPLPTKSMDALTIMAIKREGSREFFDMMCDWKPFGFEEGDSD